MRTTTACCTYQLNCSNLPAPMFASLVAFTFSIVVLACCSAQLDKSKAVGPCIDGLCPPRHFCAPQDNECYPREKQHAMASLHNEAQRDVPEGGAVSIGPCVNGLCPNGFDCVDNTCFKAKGASSGVSIGPCVNEKCPDGYNCNKAEYKCYANK